MISLILALVANNPGVVSLSVPQQWAVVGQEWALYYDDLIEVDGAWSYDIDWSISPSPMTAPAESSDGLTWTPADVGDYALTIELSTGGVPVADYTTTLHVAAATPMTASISVFGDSLSAGNLWQTTVASLEPGFTWLGVVGVAAGLNVDSRGGWSWALYTNSYGSDMTPLICGPGAYCDKAGAPDVIVWACSTNDAVTAGTDAARAAILARLDKLMRPWQGYDVKHVIWTTPPGADTDPPFVANYAGTAMEDQYYWEQRQRALSRAIVSHYSYRTNEGIYVAATSSGVDTSNDYPIDNALHPISSGYQRIARSVHAAMAAALGY